MLSDHINNRVSLDSELVEARNRLVIIELDWGDPSTLAVHRTKNPTFPQSRTGNAQERHEALG